MNDMPGKPHPIRSAFRFALPRWKAEAGLLLPVAALLTLGSCLEIALPTALSAFVEKLRTTAATEETLLSLGAFLGLWLLCELVLAAGFLTYNSAECRIFSKLVKDAFAKILSLPESFLSSASIGGLLGKARRARERLETFEDQIILTGIRLSVALVGSAALLALRMPGLAAILIIYLACVGAITFALVTRWAGPRQSDYALAQDGVNARFGDAVSNASLVKTGDLERSENETFGKKADELQTANLKAYHASNLVSAIQGLAIGGLLALMLGWGTIAAAKGTATVDDVAYLVLAHSILETHLRRMADNLKTLLNSSYELESAIELLEEEAGPPEAPDAMELESIDGTIVLEKASFHHPSRKEPLFDEMNLSIAAGERIALVGPSGSGKTTLLKLIRRAMDVTDGRILVGGRDVREISLSSLRRAFAVVPQDPSLFHRSLRENVLAMRPDADEVTLLKAARDARIDELVNGLDKGWDSLVGERGVKLSGGERQRIAIARALVADRPILLLDEATSALDSENERLVHEALEALGRGRTTLTVAHRLSTIVAADRILFLQNGRIIEEGTHDELLRRGGAYARMHAAQTERLVV